MPEDTARLADDTHWMARALDLAHRARDEGEVPIGAVLARGGLVLGEGWNRPVAAADPTAHAEIEALRAAARASGNYRLPGSVLYVTLEPCLMCVGALVHARVERVVYAAADPKVGALALADDLAARHALNHRLQVRAGLLADEAASLLRGYFEERRRGM